MRCCLSFRSIWCRLKRFAWKICAIYIKHWFRICQTVEWGRMTIGGKEKNKQPRQLKLNIVINRSSRKLFIGKINFTNSLALFQVSANFHICLFVYACLFFLSSFVRPKMQTFVIQHHALCRIKTVQSLQHPRHKFIAFS